MKQVTINGAAAADDVTLAAVNAIKNLPEQVGYADKDLVEAARAAYTKIATIEQQALVTNYADLISAEQRITALTPEETEPVEEELTEQEGQEGGNGVLYAVLGAGVLAGAAALLNKKRKSASQKKSEEAANAEATSEEFSIEEVPAEETPAEEQTNEE